MQIVLCLEGNIPLFTCITEQYYREIPQLIEIYLLLFIPVMTTLFLTPSLFTDTSQIQDSSLNLAYKLLGMVRVGDAQNVKSNVLILW